MRLGIALAVTTILVGCVNRPQAKLDQEVPPGINLSITTRAQLPTEIQAQQVVKDAAIGFQMAGAAAGAAGGTGYALLKCGPWAPVCATVTLPVGALAGLLMAEKQSSKRVSGPDKRTLNDSVSDYFSTTNPELALLTALNSQISGRWSIVGPLDTNNHLKVEYSSVSIRSDVDGDLSLHVIVGVDLSFDDLASTRRNIATEIAYEGEALPLWDWLYLSGTVDQEFDEANRKLARKIELLLANG